MDVQQMWQQLETKRLSLVAMENGLTQQNLVALFDQAGLTGRTPADPGPSEIAAAAAVIRAGWSQEVETARWIAARRYAGSW